VAIWLVVIFGASTALFVPERTSTFISPILRALFPHADDAGITRLHVIVRKAGHVTEYSILAILVARATLAFAQTRRAWFGISFAVVAAVAISDEFHQTFVPGRNGSPADVLLDVAAAAMMLAVIAVWRWAGMRDSDCRRGLAGTTGSR
jgi:VanZ family protein